VFNLSAAGIADIFFCRYDVNGDLVWAKQISSTQQTFGGISLDQDGNIYMAGAFSGTDDFDPGPNINSITSFGANDIFVGKYDENGNLIWIKQMGGTDYDGS